MLVEIGKGKMYITGEGTTNPSSYADIISIKKWEEPYEDLKVIEEDKKVIINYISKESPLGELKFFLTK